MIIPAAALIAMLSPPLPDVAPPYAWLPNEKTCEMMWHACNADTAELRVRWRAYGGDQPVPDGGWEFNGGGGGGWQARQCREQVRESERLAQTWYTCWYVRWTGHWFTERERDEWADILMRRIGADAFWRAEIPLPLSLR